MKTLRQGGEFTQYPVSSISMRGLGARIHRPGYDPFSMRELLNRIFDETYEITVFTGNIENAGTDANVFLSLFGSWSWIEDQLALPLGGSFDPFERNSTDRFRIHGHNLGRIRYLRIRHDNSGGKPGWFLDQIRIHQIKENVVYLFPANRWLAQDEGDCAIDLLIKPDGPAVANPNVPHPCDSSTPESPTPENYLGVSQVLFYNCHPERHTLHIWVLDAYEGSNWNEKGTLTSQYDASGNCPSSAATPLKISIPDGHLYFVVAVDPSGVTCGSNDPMILGCRFSALTLLGDKNGFVLPLVFGSERI